MEIEGGDQLKDVVLVVSTDLHVRVRVCTERTERKDIMTMGH